MLSQRDSRDGKPDYVVKLEKSYGMPCQNAFGSSVFFIPLAEQSESLEVDAAAKYRYFVGEAWDRLGEQNWKNGWCSVYERDAKSSPGILAEIQSLTDREARQSASLLLENLDGTKAAHDALRVAFDKALVTELRIFKIGDCAAMSGVLIAARLLNTGSLFLVLLLD